MNLIRREPGSPDMDHQNVRERTDPVLLLMTASILAGGLRCFSAGGGNGMGGAHECPDMGGTGAVGVLSCTGRLVRVAAWLFWNWIM